MASANSTSSMLPVCWHGWSKSRDSSCEGMQHNYDTMLATDAPREE